MELLGGAAAVIVTALLVAAVPAIDQRAQPFFGVVRSGTTIVELEIAAPNQVRWMTLVTTPQAPIAVAVRTE